MDRRRRCAGHLVGVRGRKGGRERVLAWAGSRSPGSLGWGRFGHELATREWRGEGRMFLEWQGRCGDSWMDMLMGKEV